MMRKDHTETGKDLHMNSTDKNTKSMPEISTIGVQKSLEDCLMVNHTNSPKPVPPSTSCFPKRDSVKPSQRDDTPDYTITRNKKSRKAAHRTWK